VLCSSHLLSLYGSAGENDDYGRLHKSWLYRIKPSVTHEPFHPRVPSHDYLISEFNQSSSSTTPTQLHWNPFNIPDTKTNFIDGLFTISGAGSSFLRHGFAVHMYVANASMEGCAFSNADGDFLIVPQQDKAFHFPDWIIKSTL